MRIKNIYWVLGIVFCSAFCMVEATEDSLEVKKDKLTPPVISEAKKYYSFGCEYLKNKMYDEAIKNFGKAIEDSSTFVDAYINLGLACRAKNDFDGMRQIYNKMIEIEPAKGHYALGRLYTDEKKYSDAIVEYKKSIEIDSAYVDPWYGIGYVEEKLGNIQSAIDNYSHALTLDPKNMSLKYSISKAYITVGEYEKAIKELKELRDTHPEDLDVRRTLGNALSAAKNYKEARIEFEYLAGRSPSDIPARIELGKVCEELKDYECASQSYKDAIAIDTMNISSYWYLIYLYLSTGNISKAEEYLTITKRLNPMSSQVYFLGGAVFVEKGDKLFQQKEYENAITAYNRAITEYKNVISAGDTSLLESTKKAIGITETKLKRAKEEEWWRRH